jgi:hypothetical protein
MRPDPIAAIASGEQVRCDYNIRTPVATETHVATSDPEDLPISEIELTYHRTTSTYYSLSAYSPGATKWQTLMEDVALHHHQVLHLMLAVTGLAYFPHFSLSTNISSSPPS